MQKKTIDDAMKAEIEKTLKEFKQRFVARAADGSGKGVA